MSKDAIDNEFADEFLEAWLKGAFDPVEPSAEAQARMLDALLASEKKSQAAATLAAAAPAATLAVAASAAEAAPVAPAAEATSAATAPLTNEQRIANAVALAEAAVRGTSVQEPTEALAANEGASGPAAEGEAASDAAQIVADARSSAPKAKRKIRPWQVAVPAAAAAALVAVVVLVGPLLVGSPAPDAPVESAADGAGMSSSMPSSNLYAGIADEEDLATTAAPESTAEQDVAVVGEAGDDDLLSSDMPSSVPVEELSSAAEDDAAAPDAAAEAEPAESEEAEERESEASEEESAEGAESTESDESSEGGDAGEESANASYPSDYPTIVVIIGDEYRLTIDSTTPASPDNLGNFVAEATAYNSDETASITCEIYESLDNEEVYLISYLGENVYYPSHVI